MSALRCLPAASMAAMKNFSRGVVSGLVAFEGAGGDKSVFVGVAVESSVSLVLARRVFS